LAQEELETEEAAPRALLEVSKADLNGANVARQAQACGAVRGHPVIALRRFGERR